MTPELTALAFATLLQFVQFALAATAATLELGPRTTLGPRDDGPLGPRLSPRAGRLVRALDNHFQALPLFAVAVFLVTHTEANTKFTALCGWLYLAGRTAYVPAYAFGLVPWRSAAFAVASFATLAMVLAAITQ